MTQAIIIDPYNVISDESDNERDGITLIRQLVAQAGVRVPEQAVQAAEAAATEGFAPTFFESIIFRLVNREPTLALRVQTQFRKTFTPKSVMRHDAPEIIQACRQRGLRIALTRQPTEEMSKQLYRHGAWDIIDMKGPPPKVKIQLPDIRLLEFLCGALRTRPGDCVMLGTRLDTAIRPAKQVRMPAIHLRQGSHGTRQLPRDLRDVADFSVDNAEQLVAALGELLPVA